MNPVIALVLIVGALLGMLVSLIAGPRPSRWVPAVLAAAIMFTTLVAVAQEAVAHQPYGGCAEAWQAPQSTGAKHCRAHGWTVRRNFVLGPKRYVHYMNPYRVQPCRTEDSGNCFWDARYMGNGRGRSFIIRGERDGAHRIWWVRF